LKALATAACVGLFLLMMSSVWDKFTNETTNTGTKTMYHAGSAKQLPLVTICIEEGFKDQGWNL
jgi:hypothetical protein